MKYWDIICLCILIHLFVYAGIYLFVMYLCIYTVCAFLLIDTVIPRVISWWVSRDLYCMWFGREVIFYIPGAPISFPLFYLLIYIFLQDSRNSEDMYRTNSEEGL